MTSDQRKIRRWIHGISERRACRALGQHCSTQRKIPQGQPDEERLTDDIIELARKYGRYEAKRRAPTRAASIQGRSAGAICQSALVQVCRSHLAQFAGN